MRALRSDPERSMIQPYLDQLPLVAILRGVTLGEVLAIGGALVDAGFSIIEVRSTHCIRSRACGC